MADPDRVNQREGRAGGEPDRVNQREGRAGGEPDRVNGNVRDQPMARPRPARRRRSSRGGRAADLWAPTPALARPEPIQAAGDPTALLRSLGAPPLGGQSTPAQHYMAAVVERAAGLAVALAATADLWAPAVESDTEG